MGFGRVRLGLALACLVACAPLVRAQECELDCFAVIGCKSAQLDVFYSLDESGSMYWLGSTDWPENKSDSVNRYVMATNFIKTISTDLRNAFDQNGLRQGLGQWSVEGACAAEKWGGREYKCLLETQTNTWYNQVGSATSVERFKYLYLKPRTLFSYRDPTSTSWWKTFDEALGKAFPMGRGTHAGLGMTLCQNEMPKRAADVPRICMLISDGQNFDYAEAEQAAREVKAQGITLLTIGIGPEFAKSQTRTATTVEFVQPVHRLQKYATGGDDLDQAGCDASPLAFANLFASTATKPYNPDCYFGKRNSYAAADFKQATIDKIKNDIVADLCIAVDQFKPGTCLGSGATLTVTGTGFRYKGAQKTAAFYAKLVVPKSITVAVACKATNEKEVTCTLPKLGEYTPAPAGIYIPQTYTYNGNDFKPQSYLVELSRDDGKTWTSNRAKFTYKANDGTGKCVVPTLAPFQEPSTDGEKPTVPPQVIVYSGNAGDAAAAASMSGASARNPGPPALFVFALFVLSLLCLGAQRA